jgi:hypothetical protein
MKMKIKTKFTSLVKGQMSLEMIIGLLILLVVAAVVINLFMGNIKSIGGIQKWTDSQKYKDFVSNCQGLCNDYLSNPDSKGTIAKYCSAALIGEDLNGNGIVDKIAADVLPFPVCEDAIYCFHVYNCEKDKARFDMVQCRQLLCTVYNELYKDMNKANQKVLSLIPNYGTCDMSGEDYNWWNKNFGFYPCIQPGIACPAGTVLQGGVCVQQAGTPQTTPTTPSTSYSPPAAPG